MSGPDPTDQTIIDPILHRVWEMTVQGMRAIVQYRSNSIVMDVKMPDGMLFTESAIEPLVSLAWRWRQEHLDEELAFSRELAGALPERHPRQIVLNWPNLPPIGDGWNRVEVDTSALPIADRSPDLRLVPVGIGMWLLHYLKGGPQFAPRPPDLREYYILDVRRRGVLGCDTKHSVDRVKMLLSHFVTLMQTLEDDVMRGVAPRHITDDESEILRHYLKSDLCKTVSNSEGTHMMIKIDMLDFRQTPFPNVLGPRSERSGVGVAAEGREPLVVAPRVAQPFVDTEGVPPHWERTRLYLVDKDSFFIDLSAAVEQNDKTMLAGMLGYAASQWCAELDRFDTQLAALAPGHPRLGSIACPPVPAVGLGMQRLGGKPETPLSAKMPLTIAYAGDGTFLIDTRTTELQDIDVSPNMIVGIQLIAPDQATLLGGPEEPIPRFLTLMALFASALMAVAWPQQRLVLEGQDPSTLPWATNQTPAAQALLAQRSSLAPTVRPLPLRTFSPGGDPVRSRPASPEPALTVPASERKPDTPALFAHSPDGKIYMEPYTGPLEQFQFGAEVNDPSSPTGKSLMIYMSAPTLPTGKITVSDRAINLHEVLPTGPPRAKPATPAATTKTAQNASRPRPEDIGAEKAGCSCVVM